MTLYINVAFQKREHLKLRDYVREDIIREFNLFILLEN